MQKCIESTISGKNLGYDYLLWINRQATRLGLKGITFFKSDGSIKVIAEGEEKNLLFLIKKLRTKFLFFISHKYFSAEKSREPSSPRQAPALRLGPLPYLTPCLECNFSISFSSNSSFFSFPLSPRTFSAPSGKRFNDLTNSERYSF